ncbi:MAG: AAA family ATPase [Saprospiraceae bacterium]|nr:AAA family ATPase [Saprospiraceae bacterium]
MTRSSPFKFLDSYQKDDLDVFFGREQETDKLFDALSGVKHLLVYGPSGAGKTSLIECGLRNQFSDADWLALTIRRGNNLNDSVFARIREQLHTPFDPGPDFDFGQAVEALFDEQYKPVYLLFDQFEELLIQGSHAEKTEFFTRLNRLIRYKTPCRILLIMREEFIGHLSEFEPLCPSLFQHRFRLEKMNRSNVQRTIENMLTAPRYLAHFSVTDAELLAQTILSKLPDTQLEIELAHVQVFLGELWDRALAEVPRSQKQTGLPRLHAGLVQPDDNLERVLDRFLKNQLAELKPTYGEKAPLELLAAMISERHTKLQAGIAELEAALSKNAVALSQPLSALLQELEQRRILRTLKSGENTQYEISHDVLARVVGQNLTEEMKLREKARDVYRVYEERQGLFSRDDLDYLRAFEAFLTMPERLKARMVESEKELTRKEREELENTRRRLRLVRGLLGAAVLALVVAGYFAYAASVSEEQAVISATQAAESARQAKENEEIALDASKKAETRRIEADSAKTVALREKTKAEAALQRQLAAEREAKRQQLQSYRAQAGDFNSKKQYDDAIAAYRSALTLAEDAKTRRELQSLIAQCQSDKRDYDFNVAKNRGLRLADIGECRAALSYLRAAVAIRPDDTAVVDALKKCQ